MKKIILLTLLGVLLVTTFSCIKDETCKFEDSTFYGKWKITKIVENEKDVTDSFFKLIPCEKTSEYLYSNNNIMTQTNTVSSCSVGGDRIWNLKTISSKNYLIMNDDGQIDYDTVEVTSFSCNSIVLFNSEHAFTLTKQ